MLIVRKKNTGERQNTFENVFRIGMHSTTVPFQINKRGYKHIWRFLDINLLHSFLKFT